MYRSERGDWRVQSTAAVETTPRPLVTGFLTPRTATRQSREVSLVRMAGSCIEYFAIGSMMNPVREVQRDDQVVTD